MAKRYNFFGLLSRMRLIKRWSLMRNLNPENITEHSFDVALIAHNLAWLRRLRFAEPGTITPDPNYVMAVALFHDATEIITGDLPTPVKYYDENMRRTFARLEEEATHRLLGLLPEDLYPVYRNLLQPTEDDATGKAALELVKAADKISAYLKCLQETNQGNSEFEPAKKSIEKILDEMKMPEVDCFMREFAPAYGLALDELT